MKTVFLVVRHLARSAQDTPCRVLILVDSMVALGAIAKGRSSAVALLRVNRKLAAYTLGCRIKVYVRYVPSEVNPADGPSRGLRVGVASETRAAHADRLLDERTLHPLLRLLLRHEAGGRGHAGG